MYEGGRGNSAQETIERQRGPAPFSGLYCSLKAMFLHALKQLKKPSMSMKKLIESSYPSEDGHRAYPELMHLNYD